MTTKSHTQKDGTIWEWEETNEFTKALKSYLKLVKENERKNSN
jgi:hypothetical protein